MKIINDIDLIKRKEDELAKSVSSADTPDELFFDNLLDLCTLNKLEDKFNK